MVFWFSRKCVCLTERTVARNDFELTHVPWFTCPSCLTAKLSNAPSRTALTSFPFLFHLHRRSTITRLRSEPGANNALARSHFHNSHAFRLFRASRRSLGRPRLYSRSCAPVISGAPSGFALRNIAIHQRMRSGRSVLRIQSRWSKTSGTQKNISSKTK